MELEIWPEAIKVARNKPLMLSALGGKYNLYIKNIFRYYIVLNSYIIFPIIIGLIWFLLSGIWFIFNYTFIFIGNL